MATKTTKKPVAPAKAATPTKAATKTTTKAPAKTPASPPAKPAAKTLPKAAPKAAAKKVATKPVAKKPLAKGVSPATAKLAADPAASANVLTELKSLAKELNKAAKGLNKKSTGNPKEVSAILGSVERMTADAANKSLAEAELAKALVSTTLDTLSKNWSRQDIEASLKAVAGHLTNIIVAQEFQDLAGQSLRKAMKALVGAIIVVEGGGPTEDKRLSQSEIDGLLNDLMP